MKKFLSLTLALIMTMALAVPAFASDTVSLGVSDGSTVVKTCENTAGETVTGVITNKDSDVVAVCTSSEDGNDTRGFIMDAPSEVAVAAHSDDSGIAPLSEVSDYFYIVLYNSKDEMLSKYKVALEGKITAISRKITSVTITRVSGDVCDTDYTIDGKSAYVIVTHPGGGYMDGTFTLNWDGTFTVT